MRIFHLCAGAKTGGAETAFVETCIAMKQAGWDVTALCRPHANMTGPLGEADVPTYTAPFGGVFDFRTKGLIRSLIKEQKPDIVQVWMNRAAKFCPRPDAKLPPFTLVARLGGYYDLKYYKGVERFVANTADIKRYLGEHGVPEHNVTVINNLVTMDGDYTPLPRAEFDTPEDAVVFLTLSRLHEVKGIDDFLEALAALPDNAYGWIAGDGPDRAKLESHARTLGIAHRVRFLGWRNDRTALLKTADILVFPSRFEPFGNTFAQGWAAGIPLITTATAGPSLFVQDGQDALMIPVGDQAALAKAMTGLMDNQDLAVSLASNGLCRFEEEFTTGATLAAYEAFYKSLPQNH